MKKAPTRLIALALAVGGGLAGGSSVLADFRQYSPPGAFGTQVEPTSRVVEDGVANARWRIGRVFLDPWFGIRDVSRVKVGRTRGDAQRGRNDLTATATAGLRAYIPTNSGLTIAAHALPGYVWWDELSERNRLNGIYGVGAFGQVRRLNLEVSASQENDSRFFSRQFEERVNSKVREFLASGVYDLGRGLEAFGSFSPRRVDYDADSTFVEAERLNRRETVSRAGLRYALGSGVTLGAGIEHSDTDFSRANDPRSNTGTSPMFTGQWTRSPVRASLQLQLRDLQSDVQRDLKFSETTGRLDASFRVSGPLRFEAGTYRHVVYSAQPEWAWYSDKGTGAALRISLRSRASVRVFVEDGTNDYQALGAGRPRVDDFSSVGATLHFNVGKARLEVGWTDTTYNSNLPDFDRTVTTLISGLRFNRSRFSPWG